jgi:hypothetical protein
MMPLTGSSRSQMMFRSRSSREHLAVSLIAVRETPRAL